MLFEEKIDPRCAYCARGIPLEDGQVACPKRGIVSPGGSCGGFRYDPLKRVPPPPAAPKSGGFTAGVDLFFKQHGDGLLPGDLSFVT